MILCCGEALIDMLPGTTVDGAPCFVPKAGGAVFNTAIALGRLGADVSLFTGVSNDLFGRLLQSELRASKVGTEHLLSRDAPSSLAFVELNEGQASYTFYTDNAADTSLTQADRPRDLGHVAAMFFGGISLCADPTASTMHAMLRDKAQGCTAMIDPNIRPAFITDERAYRARLQDMIHMCDIVKISDEDLDWLVPQPAETQAKLAALTKGDKLCFVTKGAHGAEAYIGTRKIAHAPAQPAMVVDTIGAGDTFNAAILHGLEQSQALTSCAAGRADESAVQRALELAVRAASVTVSRQGANPPWAQELALK